MGWLLGGLAGRSVPGVATPVGIAVDCIVAVRDDTGAASVVSLSAGNGSSVGRTVGTTVDGSLVPGTS